MQQQDQFKKIDTPEEIEALSEQADTDNVAEAPIESTEERSIPEGSSPALAQAGAQPQRGRFDWPALIAALAVAAFFALTARFNSQPSPSYIPAAVFSATGCGLLVTAIHKLRRRTGAGLLEAGLSGFGMALFQCLMAFTYPNVLTTITTMPEYSRAFFITWGLIALFAVVLSLAGATIGHLAFTPLRPVPVRAQKQNPEDEADEEEVQESDEAPAQSTSAAQNKSAGSTPISEVEEPDNEEVEDEAKMETSEEDEGTEDDGGEEDDEAELDGNVDEDEDNHELVATAAQPRRPLTGYAITVLLLGLLPMMAGYVFAATYDFMMNAINVDAISPALYPTLSLLSGLLPWRLAAPITLSGQNGAFIVFTLLWRVPDSVLGNPNLFDVQALESLVFNAAGLALLLITMYSSDSHTNERRPAPWGIFLFLEALFGLILVLPANLWLLRGLEGVLQMGGIVAALPTIQLINPVLFTLNLVTGVLFCLVIGLIVRRQYQLWTTPRVKAPVEPEEI